MERLKEKTIKSVVWVGSTKLIWQALSWVGTLLLVRILSPADFGLMGIISAYQAIIIVIYDLGIGEAIIQKQDLEEEDLSTCFWFTVGFGVLLTVVTWLISPQIGIFFKNEQLKWMLRVSGLGILCLSIKEIHTVLLCRKLDFNKRSKAQLFSGMVSLGISLLGAVNGLGVWSLVIGLLSQHLFHALLTFYFERWRPKYFFSKNRLFQVFGFSIRIVGFNCLNYFTSNSDTVIIGKYLDARLLGFYRIAMDLSRIPIDKFAVIINQVCFPVFSRLQNNIGELRFYFLKVTKYISFLTFPILIGMALVSREFVEVALTAKWLPAAGMIKVFCVVGILQSFNGSFLVLLKSRGRVNVMVKYSLLGAIVFPCAFLLTVSYGVKVMAYCWLVLYPLLFAFLTFHVLSEVGIGVKEFIRNILPTIKGACVMSMCVLGAKIIIGSNENVVFVLITYILIGVLGYCGYFWFFSRSTVKEMRSLVQIAFSRG